MIDINVCVSQMGMMLLERTDLISDKASSHVIRALVQTMAGVRVAGESMTGNYT